MDVEIQIVKTHHGLFFWISTFSKNDGLVIMCNFDTLDIGDITNFFASQNIMHVNVGAMLFCVCVLHRIYYMT